MKSNMKDIVISAPGKVILHGEHAVVYGKKALAASLDLRTYLQLKSDGGNNIKVNLPDIDVNISWTKAELESSLKLPLCDPTSPTAPSEELLEQLRVLAGLNSQTTDTRSLALVSFLYLYCSISYKDGKLPAIDLLLGSRLPPSAGLGSSAAYSACLAAGLLELAGLIPTVKEGEVGYLPDHLDLINKWAFQSEKVIHGNPSGIDNSVSTYGGALCFQAGKITPITRVPKLNILLTNTKVPRSTKVLVAGVKDKYNKFPTIIEPVINSIEAITSQCEDTFKEMEEQVKEDHFDTLKELITMNQHHLATLGVSHPTLEEVCHLTSRRGLQSKLTGAGGGGCAFTLIPPGTEKSVVSQVTQDLTAKGFTCWQTVMGGLGVRRHTNTDSLRDLPDSFITS